jgi:hypothetical protein
MVLTMVWADKDAGLTVSRSLENAGQETIYPAMFVIITKVLEP